MKDSWRKEKEVKKKLCTRAWCGVLAAALVVTSTSSVMLAEAAKAPKLNKKTITLRAGAKKQLKVKNLKKKQKVKWKSSKKKIATVSKKGLVRAKKIGITKIVAKVGKKKLVCHVRVLPKKIVIRRPKPMPVATPVRVVTPKPTAMVQPSETTNVRPTMDVTAKPTIAPTVKPTMVPTVKPTTAPTATPTASPSSAPTAPARTTTPSPSAVPIVKPTASPSTAPTTKPTATSTQTAKPSAGPTATPTKMPSAAPLPTPARTTTPSPSAAPIVKPTASPSTAPTTKPTATPTQTAKPSATPMATPTQTAKPSATPAATPTPTQTAKPSASPTVTPAPTPSAAPQPSATPTATPTVKPTATPTVKPTATPTEKPTATPTVKPTATPTAKPTATPTVKPTATPTVKPTATPTVKPTATPTVKPTATPTVKPTATPTVKPTATPTVKPTATPTVKPTVKPTATPSGNAGQNVNLNGKKAFTIAGYQLALGLTRDEVNTVLGSLKTDVKRTAKSPQGFDVIAFRAGGNDTDKSFDEKHSTYILIYLKDDIVVGISGNASSMNFDGTVSYGTSAATLVSNGWVDVDWYKTTAGDAAAYSKDVDNATIIAFADAYGDDKVYSIQIFNNAYSIADMTQCTETTLPMNYSADVLTEMETETFEILNAYLVNTGVRDADVKAIRKNTKVSNVARAYSKKIADGGQTDAADVERDSAQIKTALKNAGISFDKWGERILIGNMDAIGFANSVIESNDARNTLISADYTICGIGASVYTESAGKAVYYPNMVIDFIDMVSTL